MEAVTERAKSKSSSERNATLAGNQYAPAPLRGRSPYSRHWLRSGRKPHDRSRSLSKTGRTRNKSRSGDKTGWTPGEAGTYTRWGRHSASEPSALRRSSNRQQSNSPEYGYEQQPL